MIFNTSYSNNNYRIKDVEYIFNNRYIPVFSLLYKINGLISPSIFSYFDNLRYFSLYKLTSFVITDPNLKRRIFNCPHIGGFILKNEEIDLNYALIIKKNKVSYAKKSLLKDRSINDEYLELWIKSSAPNFYKDKVFSFYRNQFSNFCIDDRIIEKDNLNDIFIKVKSPEFQTIDHYQKWLINRSREFRKKERVII